jgi:dipeptidyl aminopeptidase/acylaminoacyl peptidase
MLRRHVALVAGLALAFGLPSPRTAAAAPQPPACADFLTVGTIGDVAISPDGTHVAYTLTHADFEADRYKTNLWIVATDGSGAKVIGDDERARSPQWSPDGAKLAAIVGSGQISVADAVSGAAQKLGPAGGVTAFAWSPDGRSIAYLAPESARPAPSGSPEPYVYDKFSDVVYEILGNPTYSFPRIRLHVADLSSSQDVLASGAVDAATLLWNHAGTSIAVRGASDKNTTGTQGIFSKNSIWIYSIGAKTWREILDARNGLDIDRNLGYTDLAFSSDDRELLYHPSRGSQRFAEPLEIGAYNLATGKSRTVVPAGNADWYGFRVLGEDGQRLYFQQTVAARGGVFALDLRMGAIRPLYWPSSGSATSFSLSSATHKLAFVHDSFADSPELFVTSIGATTAQQMTRVNAEIPASSVEHRSFSWKSSDGTSVSGLLVLPKQRPSGARLPLIVLVHGGPGVAVGDAYFPPGLGGIGGPGFEWPYPFRYFATHGYAILMPNYRATGSFGVAFRSPPTPFEAAAEDIVTGVRAVEHTGIADPTRVAILGHSHGGFLGPYVYTHYRIFKAASFAEGGGNLLTMYGQMAGWLNLYNHEYTVGANPYENPQRYVAESPVFAVRGLQTPTLLEAGQQSLAVSELDMASSLWRNGVPSEFVVYPKTGHNIMTPQFQCKAARLNADWIDYWVRGLQDPDPAMSGEYARWALSVSEAKQMRGLKVRPATH